MTCLDSQLGRTRAWSAFVGVPQPARLAIGLAFLAVGLVLLRFGGNDSWAALIVGAVLELAGAGIAAHSVLARPPFDDNLNQRLRHEPGDGATISGHWTGRLGNLRFLRQCVLKLGASGVVVTSAHRSCHFEWDRVDKVRGNLDGPFRSNLWFLPKRGRGVDLIPRGFDFIPPESAALEQALASIPATVRSSVRRWTYNWCLQIVRWVITVETVLWLILIAWEFLFFPSDRGDMVLFDALVAVGSAWGALTAMRFPKITAGTYLSAFGLSACGLVFGLFFLIASGSTTWMALDASVGVGLLVANTLIVVLMSIASLTMERIVTSGPAVGAPDLH